MRACLQLWWPEWGHLASSIYPQSGSIVMIMSFVPGTNNVVANSAWLLYVSLVWVSCPIQIVIRVLYNRHLRLNGIHSFLLSKTLHYIVST